MLCFMVVGVSSNIKTTIGHFATKSATSGDLYPLLWKAIAYLEMAADLKVISSSSDKASPNMKLYRMHRIGNIRGTVVYKAKNPYASDEDRWIYFFSDICHLLKTLR